MNYLYHRMPTNMEGVLLHPLNDLKKIFPNQYKEHIKKYIGREKLITEEIAPLHCLWNDVIHLTAVSPNEIRKSLAIAGIDMKPSTWFKIPASSIIGEKSIAFVYRKNNNILTNCIDYEIFDLKKIDTYRIIPKETIEYYKEMKKQGKNPLLFHFVPHILYKGNINIEELDRITI